MHREALEQGLTTMLGEPFLRTLYDELLRNGLAFLVAAREGDRLAGFILATTDATRTMSVVIRAPHRFAGSILSAVARRPSLVGKIVETLSYGRKTGGLGRAELVVIAVRPDLRSQGVGRRLVGLLDDELSRRGIRTYMVTVHSDMTSANRFYAQNGFRPGRSFQLHGVRWELYVRELGTPTDQRASSS